MKLFVCLPMAKSLLKWISQREDIHTCNKHQMKTEISLHQCDQLILLTWLSDIIVAIITTKSSRRTKPINSFKLFFFFIQITYLQYIAQSKSGRKVKQFFDGILKVSEPIELLTLSTQFLCCCFFSSHMQYHCYFVCLVSHFRNQSIWINRPPMVFAFFHFPNIYTYFHYIISFAVFMLLLCLMYHLTFQF